MNTYYTKRQTQGLLKAYGVDSTLLPKKEQKTLIEFPFQPLRFVIIRKTEKKSTYGETLYQFTFTNTL
jgi:hypothetical protein